MSLVVREIRASSYRSLRSIRFPTGRLTVFVGPNGVGKTNLYRVLQLLQAAAGGTLSRELAAEGGMQSALWAGRRRAGQPARIVLSAGFGEVSGSNDAAAEAVHSYEVEAGVIYSYRTEAACLPLACPMPFPLNRKSRRKRSSFIIGAARGNYLSGEDRP